MSNKKFHVVLCPPPFAPDPGDVTALPCPLRLERARKTWKTEDEKHTRKSQNVFYVCPIISAKIFHCPFSLRVAWKRRQWYHFRFCGRNIFYDQLHFSNLYRQHRIYDIPRCRKL